MTKKPLSKPKNLAKAALMSSIFRQKEHGKSNKHYDRRKEKKVDLRERILDRLNEETIRPYKDWKELYLDGKKEKIKDIVQYIMDNTDDPKAFNSYAFTDGYREKVTSWVDKQK